MLNFYLIFSTREEIIALIHLLVNAVNEIYESTNFGGVRGINFIVQRISVIIYFIQKIFLTKVINL